MKKQLYITTAIPYVNAKPHIGNALDYLLADIWARYQREKNPNINVRFQVGTDEHGNKIEQKAKELNLEILAYISSYASAGLDPRYMGLGPIFSTRKLLDKSNINIKDIDLFEINEAFATQTLAVIKELNLDVDKVNVNGGAIALGHPIGASGSRIVVSLIHEMKKVESKSNKEYLLYEILNFYLMLIA